MKLTQLAILAALICTVAAIQLPPFLTGRKRLPLPVLNAPGGPLLRPLQHQDPGAHTSPNIVMPPSIPDDDATGDNPTSNIIISDILAKTRQVNIFASLTRDIEPISTRLDDKSKNTTVLAPLNSAIQALPRKPWEDPEDYERFGIANAYKGQEGEDRARQNLRRFVEAHLVPASPWNEGEEVETIGGGKVSWTKDGDKIFIQPGNIEVHSVASQASNGDVWILKGVINYKPN
ncbi:hypothetical protein VTN77DRAFT_5138 [Rasamsonia byssochlamydoides]|uniref:uncharacterized protein n=1 Tax=Rasamsonia byssochlamydoides TaxID=89139 RepID=UPI0037441DC7